ncbi:hypothetical protein H0H93_008763 [Arthromyces matolae]|nr:hypothetical protein H0H93_008763 [Arthromyces matolae]
MLIELDDYVIQSSLPLAIYYLPMHKRNVSASVPSGPDPKRIQAGTATATDTEIDFYAKYINIISTQPEMKSLPRHEELSKKLLSLQQRLDILFPFELKSYFRLYDLEFHLLSFCTEGHNYRFSAYPDLAASLKTAKELLHTLLQYRFIVIKGNPAILGEAIQMFDETLSPFSLSRLSLIERKALQIHQFKANQWTPHQTPLSEISERTLHIIRRPLGQSQKSNRKALFAIDDPPETWSHAMPVFKGRQKHWVTLVADMKKKEIAILDSMGGEEAFDRKLAQILGKVLNAYLDQRNHYL